jgi:type I restriction enzyme S subunit
MSACLTIPACINQNVAGIVPRAARLDSRYLHHVLTHAYEPIRQVGRGGQQEALNCEIIKAFRIPLPPVVEQKEIGERLDSVIAQSSTVVASMAAQIESLREYRQALISAAVTGQIDIPAELAEVGV